MTIAREFYYKAFLNEHPFVCEMLGLLNQKGPQGLLNPPSTSDMKRQLRNYDDFSGFWPTANVETPYPLTEFDFSFSGPYSIYNWEIFFHSVSHIARQLRQNNKFAEAIRWLNFVFDPADTDADLLDLRFWQIKPFMINVTQESIQNMIRLLSASNLSPQDMLLRLQYEAQIAEWRRNPFDPHAIAAMRPRAYMLWTVMEYVTTLTDWGDYLFRQDTMESINEAINLYVIASEILGPRPKKVDRPSPAPKCFDEMMGQLSSFSNTLVAFEDQMTGISLCDCSLDLTSDSDSAHAGSGCSGHTNTGTTSIPDLYFCVPDNPKLIEMWDRVEDRLFKIRHCMNIDGKVRQLALFSPPIDPALLVQAAAAGLSIGDAIANASAPLPFYRFNYLLQKANELTSEVKALGSQLLTLLEKKDAEELSLFRQVHEQNILKSVRAVKQLALDEAMQSKATLESSKNLIKIRLDDYNNREYRNDRELSAMKLTRAADGFMYAEQGARLIAGIFSLFPDITTKVHIQGTASGGTLDVKTPASGVKIANAINAGASALTIVTSALRNKASQSLTYASYDRREEEWVLQRKMATEELAQVEVQLKGADIRIHMAQTELNNHDLQIAQSEEMYEWLKNKYTNGKLYTWMASQVKTVYNKAFELAFSMAKKAQVCYDHELGFSATNIIQYGQWDSTRSGLLAGERLGLQLKQLETEYIRNNSRDYELTKSISLALLDPSALMDLILNGTCNFAIPELLFDLDHPGQYLRRIKSVSISIPCISGPNTNINARLTLIDHSIRNKANYSDVLINKSGNGECIATSSAQNDSGMFEVNLKDERYLPFEGKGAISSWSLDLTQIERASDKPIRQFDFTTISDVVIHMKYTAKYDGVFAASVAESVDNDLSILADTIGVNGLQYAFSLRHDMPAAWHQLRQNLSCKVTITKNRLPYFVQAINPVITELKLMADTTGINSVTYPDPYSITVDTDTKPIAQVGSTAFYSNAWTNVALDTEFDIEQDASLPASELKDIVLIVKLAVS